MTSPTSAQYQLGVEIGRLVIAARDRGMGWDDIVSTLRHSANLTEDRRDLDLMIAAAAARDAMATL